MPHMRAAAEHKRIYTVSQLAGSARFLLEEHFPLVWVEGELSNLRAPTSGHWYFTLKDAQSQIRCAMFAGRNRLVRFRPKDGDQVVVRGRVSLYEARGDFQLIADHLEPSGEGALRAAFEALVRKLTAEGLFDESRKRPLPDFPRHVAVISSRHGAALRDVLSVFRRRCPVLRITLLPVAVQGREAEGQIIAALDRIADWPKRFGDGPDVVIVTRGGGSLEDLAAFNLESVARAIRACRVPVVAAVGHETDVTLADFAADLRAPTPSAGAEQIAPDLAHWQQRLARSSRTLAAHFEHARARRRQALDHLSRRLVHPGRALQQRMQRLDDFERRLVQGWQRHHVRLTGQVALLRARLSRYEPSREIQDARQRLLSQLRALRRALSVSLEHRALAVTHAGRSLHAVSPLETLGRGYAIVTTPAPPGTRWGEPISSVTATRPGAQVVAHLADGRLNCTVDNLERDAG